MTIIPNIVYNPFIYSTYYLVFLQVKIPIHWYLMGEYDYLLLQKTKIRMYTRHFFIFFLLSLFVFVHTGIKASPKTDKKYSIEGRFFDASTRESLPFAVIALDNNKVWATADKDGCFTLNDIEAGEQVFSVYLLGYVEKRIKVNVTRNVIGWEIPLQAVSLQLDEVCIVADATAKKTTASSSYRVDRTAMEHLQATNITDVMSLLPGGKLRGDLNLTNSNANFEVRGNKYEMNSTSFATAVEVDGVRLNNNASFGKMSGADNRSLPVSNVEAVEVITGIPSVEYGDLNSGLVKIRTAKGRTPYVVEMVTKPHTKLLALRKGFVVGRGGTVNASLERARSVSELISPYTSYVRNGINLNYSQRMNPSSTRPLILDAAFSGNIGGYDSKNDPDKVGENYKKVQDNGFRTSIGLDWKPNTRILSSLSWNASLSYSSKLRTDNELVTKSASSAALHTTENGYYMAEDYDTNPNANVIILYPGHYYQKRFYDDKPLYFSTKLKADSRNTYGKHLFNHVMLGGEYSFARNNGRGEYYHDIRLAPTWREYQLRNNPGMHNLSFFLEDNLDIETWNDSHLKLTAGIRSDITMIKGSDYGTVAALSPRFNARYVFWENRDHIVSNLEVHAGWGKAVKLPSFNILYPQPEYVDIPIFTTPNNEANIAQTAYMTRANHIKYNRDLIWQSSRQWEVGMNASIAGMDMGVLFYRNVVNDAYVQQSSYLPFSYNYTGPSSLEGLSIPSDRRSYAIDPHTGVVTVTDRTGQLPPQIADYTTYNRFIANGQYVNGAPVERMGVEYYLNFPQIRAINTEIRLDGNFYHYRGLNEVLSQYHPGMYANMSNGQPYEYVGYFVGGASPVNGQTSSEVNLNLMLTTHIPKIRLIVSLRLETTLMQRSQSLSEWSGGTRSYVLADKDSYIGTEPAAYGKDQLTVTYPLYYSTWSNPEVKIPFMEKFLWAEKHDRQLYNDLTQLVQRSGSPYQLDPMKISPYYSVNLNITKELGKIASVSFYASNFLNNMQKVYVTQGVKQEGTILGTDYISRFYYGLSVRLKF